MEGPGGYQFVGRTVQMWNTWGKSDQPWLLRFFDQIRFYPVEADELLDMRDRFPHGKFELKITEEQFRLRDYHAFLKEIRDESQTFKDRQQAAFEEERQRWKDKPFEEKDPQPEAVERAVPAGCRALKSPAHASVWNIGVKAGDRVEAGQRLIVVESMKMEIAVATPFAGTVVEILCSQGAQVAAGQALLFLEPSA
jgi:urea carboxylase